VSSRLKDLVPAWVTGYRREWLPADLVAGLIVWSVVTPQCVAYAQIAGLPPVAGLMAAPGAMIGYSLVGGSRSLIVSATTATSAVSASAIGPLAHGDVARFATLSAALAIMAAVVLVAAGLLRIGGIADLVSKPVMTGFLFGLGLTIMLGQLPSLFGVSTGSGGFFVKLGDLIGKLDGLDVTTTVVGVGCLAALVALRAFVPRIPGTLVVLALAIVVSAALGLRHHGADVVGHLPSGLPHPSFPGASGKDFISLVAPALGVMLMSTEAIGVARALASQQRYSIDPNRELIALGASNLLAGLSKGFVQSGGASQTAAADSAGGRSQLTGVIAAALILLTGAFLAPLFSDLPEATLAAIVIVAVSGFVRVDELRRFARVRRSAIVLALVALAGVLGLGVLRGLIVAAGLSLVLVIHRLSRPHVRTLVRDPQRPLWLDATTHPDWRAPDGVLVLASRGPLFYGNTMYVKEHLLKLIEERSPHTVVLDLADSDDLDVETADALAELAQELPERSVSLTLSSVRARARTTLERAGLTDALPIAATIDEAIDGPVDRASGASRRRG
jgi:high affinity sulfate transporter 1